MIELTFPFLSATLKSEDYISGTEVRSVFDHKAGLSLLQLDEYRTLS